MSDVMEAFPHLNSMKQEELLSHYQRLKAQAPPSQLSDATLQELLAISRVLRKRAAAPIAKSTEAAAPTLDAL